MRAAELVIVTSRRKLLGDTGALFLVQVANYVVPLLTLPLLLRALGVEKFGLLAFSQAFVQYFVLLCDYGFNLSASRDIAKIRDDRRKVAVSIISVQLARVGLSAIAVVIVVAVIVALPHFFQDRDVYFAALLAILATLSFPQWFFQGLGSLRLFAVAQLVARVTSLVLLILTVHGPEDIEIALAVQYAPLIVLGLLTVPYVWRRNKLVVVSPRISDIRDALRRGWHTFLSTASVSLYTVSNVFVLGLLASDVVVGYYSLAERLVRAASGLITPFVQVAYPHVARVAIGSRVEALRLLSKLTALLVTIGLISGLLLFAAAEPVVLIIGGSSYRPSAAILQIMAIIPVAIALNTTWGTLAMLNFEMDASLSRILLAGGLVNLGLLLVLTPALFAIGAAVAVSLTELAIAAVMAVMLYRNGVLPGMPRRSRP